MYMHLEKNLVLMAFVGMIKKMVSCSPGSLAPPARNICTT